MTGLESLRRGASATVLGNVLYAASQFAVIVVTARLTSPADVGRYAWSLSVSAPVFLFVGMRMRQLIVTDVRYVFTERMYSLLRAWSSILAVGIICVFGMLIGLGLEAWRVLVPVLLLKTAEAQVDVIYGVLQRVGRLGAVGINLCLRASASWFAYFVTLYITSSVSAGIVAMAFVAMCAFVALRVKYPWPTSNMSPRRSTWALLRTGMPLAVADCSASLIVVVPRLVVESKMGASELGVFAVLSYAVVAVGTVVGSIAEAALPRLALLVQSGAVLPFRRMVSRLAWMGIAVGGLGTLCAALVGPFLISRSFGDQYTGVGPVLVTLMVSTVFQFAALFVGAAVSAMRLFRIQVPINALVLAVVLLCSVLFVDSWGLFGAAVAVVAGQASLGFCYALVYWRVLSEGAPSLSRIE